MSLSDIVDVQVSLAAANPARRGFGQLLFIAFHSVWTDVQVRRYSSRSAVAEDFSADSAVGKAADAFFAQNPRPRYFKVARLPAPATDQTYTVDCTGLTSSDAPFAGSATLEDGTTVTWSVAWNTSLSQTMTDVATAITALTGVTGSSTSTSYSLAVDTNGQIAGMTVGSGFLREVTADWDIDDALDAILPIDADFYGVATSSNSPKNMDKLARWCEANDRLALFAPQYDDPSDFVSGEFTSGSDYTALKANDAAVGLFTANPRTDFGEIRWASAMFARDPGSATWAFKALAGFGADTWNDTQQGVIDTTNHGNFYVTLLGLSRTRPGKCFGGQWIDVVIGLAWLVSTIEERFYGVLASVDKIPYTDAGAQQIVNELRGVLKEAEDRTILAPGESQVTVIPVADQDPDDRAARIMRGIEFTGRLAGAVHELVIRGTVTE